MQHALITLIMPCCCPLVEPKLLCGHLVFIHLLYSLTARQHGCNLQYKVLKGSESREKVQQLHHQKILLALSNYQIINFAHYILAFLTLVCINFTLGTLFKI